MAKILVTGGAGFIGSHIVDLLILKGHDVIIIDDMSKGRTEFLNPKAKLYKININEYLDQIFMKEKPEIVLHLAAQVMLRKSIEDPIEDSTINILGTLNVLETCRRHKIKKFIYTSTGGARVGEPKYLPVDENHPIAPLSPYGISKYVAEHLVRVYAELYGFDYLIFCFGNVYGPRDDPANKRLTSIFTHQILNGITPKIFGDGDQTRDFLYVKDLADFIVGNLFLTPKHKLFHLANGEQVSVNQIYALLKEYIEYTVNVQHIDAIPGEVRDIVLDTRLAKSELGWSPKYTLREGIKEMVEWFKESKTFK